MVSCASEGVRWRGVSGSEEEEEEVGSGSWRIMQGGGPSAGFVLLAILVLGAAVEGSMFERAEAGPA